MFIASNNQIVNSYSKSGGWKKHILVAWEIEKNIPDPVLIPPLKKGEVLLIETGAHAYISGDGNNFSNKDAVEKFYE